MLSGRLPVPEFKRVAFTRLRTCASVKPDLFAGSKATHVLNSAAVMGWRTPPTSSPVNSVGKVPRPKGVLPVLLKRKFGWLKALIKSILKLMRRFPSALANGHGKSFESEESKYS